MKVNIATIRSRSGKERRISWVGDDTMMPGDVVVSVITGSSGISSVDGNNPPPDPDEMLEELSKVADVVESIQQASVWRRMYVRYLWWRARRLKRTSDYWEARAKSEFPDRDSKRSSEMHYCWAEASRRYDQFMLRHGLDDDQLLKFK